MSFLKRHRWVLSLLLVSAIASVLVAGPVIAGSGSPTKIIKKNTGVFYKVIPHGNYADGLAGTTVATLSLPPGSYAVTANPTMSAVSGGRSTHHCDLVVGGAVLDRGEAVLDSGIPLGQLGRDSQVVVQGAIQLKRRGTVSLNCNSGSGVGTGGVFSGWVVATRGATLKSG